MNIALTGPRRYAKRLSRHARTLDAALALAAFALGLTALFSGGIGEPEPGTRDGDALGVALFALATLPLAARGVAPGIALALSAGAIVPIAALHYPGEIANAPVFALYSLAAQRSRERSGGRAALALAIAAYGTIAVAFAIADGNGFPAPEIATVGALWLGVWIAGDRARLRGERMTELEQRARQMEQAAERERLLAAAEERTRIARELHDSAGHAMNVILVEAGAARLLRDRDPERSRAALETIEELARGTIGEIDRLVRALREDEGLGDDGLPLTAPLPRLQPIETLAERHHVAGLRVGTRVDGTARPLPAALDRAAYRIVQEALTNAAKHGRDEAALVVSFGPSALELTITNPMRANGPARTTGGHGIVGMRERAQLLGGRLDVGREGALFRVHAELPYREDER